MRASAETLAVAAALMAASAGPLLAVEPIPLKAGTYCGPAGAKIVVDVANDQVTIDNLVCRFPVIAADHMQSNLCSDAQGHSMAKRFSFSVVGRTFLHDGNTYSLCAPAKVGG